MNQNEITKYSLGLAVVFFAYLIKLMGFKNGKPTCDNYVINVYLYLALSIIILGILSSYIGWEKYNINPLLLFICSILFIVAISFQPNFQSSMSQVIYSHIFWVLFVLSISGTFWIYLKSPIFKDYISSTILIVSLIFAFMSMLVYVNPQFFKDTYSQAMSSLLIALLVIIIFEIFNAFFNKGYAFSQMHRMVSYIVIVIFSGFVSYDTSRVFQLADKCTKMPNYPKTSISFFLDVLNLFVRIISLRSR